MAAGTMRLLAVLELLQSRHEMTGAALAERLQVDVRSIRRYIKALQEMGIPIEGERGRYGAYHLDRGFKLPPLMFHEDEAVAVTLGLMVIRALQLPIDSVSAMGVLAKIERVLPEALLSRTLALQETLHVQYAPPHAAAQNSVVKVLLAAMHQGRRLQVTYASWDDKQTERAFDPYGIVFHEGWWYVVGCCHLRGALRTLRVDRIQQTELRAELFVRPADFDAVGQVRQALNQPDGIAAVEVLLLTSFANAQRALPAELGTLEVVADGVMFRRPAYRLEWIAPLLLSLDFPIRILQPPELKTLLRRLSDKARAMSDAADEK
ncbi:YafY family transcriptional regulator [Candidatus Gracilibacteria bacterium]|nr:YafY family transcriptional regulator [Candidatus Gracilibacteria bacterium]